MKRSGNLLAPAGFLLTLVAFLSYFIFFIRYPFTRDFPWASLLLFAAGLGLVAVGLRRAFRQTERYRGKVSGTVLAVLSVLVTGFFLTFNFYLSAQLPASEGAPRVGQKAPDFTLPDTEGNQIALSALVAELGEQETAQDNKKRGLLLVFYRGYW